MPWPRVLIAVLLALGFAAEARAGLYYSGEVYAELPSQWRGFLLDQRMLRGIAVPETSKVAASPVRVRYLEERDRLQTKAKRERLSADELADLGALHVRLGEADKAIPVLRPAHLDHPNHFRIIANLATAWQLQGDLDQAAACLRQAVRLAPGKLQKAEEYHLKLVRLRAKEDKNASRLDDLFGVRYVGEKGDYEPGKLATAERKKLPAHAVALAQHLALWLPADGRLLWQLGELANAHGDVRTAVSMMDGCVTAFNLNDKVLRKHRQILRETADKMPQPALGPKTEHERHARLLLTRSKRPLASKLDRSALPAISANGVNTVPWDVFTETTVGAKFRPAFPKYLRELDGKLVSLSGFMQPLSQDAQASAFMFIEYPVGCWYCEMPDTASIVYVELPAGKTAMIARGLVRVTGRLRLNATDPEDFLYAIREAKVGGVD